MFKFDFDIEDAEDIEGFAELKPTEPAPATSEAGLALQPFSELSLQQLFESLPHVISYSPLHIPLSSSRKATALLRRDLFDARFQLIAQSAGDAPEESEKKDIDVDQLQNHSDRQALEFLDAPSDLIPGVYEGGLKTWECSLDLVDYLDSLKDEDKHSDFIGKRIFDVGCGTGVPSMYALREVLENLDSNGKDARKTEIHLQDYNESVLQLMTLPNMLLTWYSTIHADTYRYTTNDSETAPSINLSEPGELQITAELKSAFLTSLQSLNITLRFFCGSWDTFNPLETSSNLCYDILFSSESIYRTENLASLISLMQSACTGKPISTLETLVSSLNLNEQSTTRGRSYLCLVAAKVLYFGVGGGISDFLKAVGERRGHVETVLERKTDVGRKIMVVHWP